MDGRVGAWLGGWAGGRVGGGAGAVGGVGGLGGWAMDESARPPHQDWFGEGWLRTRRKRGANAGDAGDAGDARRGCEAATLPTLPRCWVFCRVLSLPPTRAPMAASANLKWLETLGDEVSDDKEVHFLNRLIRCGVHQGSSAIFLEPDWRHLT